jgi:hypothetical protein
MTDVASDSIASLRRAVYGLMIIVSCASAAGRTMTVESSSGDTPFLSANDRSRWSTVCALVDYGTFELDDVIFRSNGKRRRDWYSIDLVKHRGWDGQERYYSSKPTLLTVALAGEYWLIKNTLGITLEEHTFYVARLMLLVTNVIPLAAYLLVLARLIERYGRTDWGRLFTFTVAAFGTFITTFAVTLNNHTLAATTAIFAIHAALHVWRERRAGWGWFAWCGTCAALTVANELPALALLALLGGALFIWKSPLKTVVGFGVPVVLVAAAALGTNYYAHGSWKTPYAHRKDGPVVAQFAYKRDGANRLADELRGGQVPVDIRDAIADRYEPLSEQAKSVTVHPFARWIVEDNDARRFVINYVDAYSKLEVREWDNWYDYEGTYWTDEFKKGVDKGEPSRWVYAFHCLLGHHGIFSLTPVWLLAAAGVWLLWRRDEPEQRGLAVLIALLTVVVFAFYVVQRPLEDRNYGGVSCGLRWMFWLIPLWLLALIPAADGMSAPRWKQGVSLALLAISVFSSHYASLNPWSQPWLFDYWTYLGWIRY